MEKKNKKKIIIIGIVVILLIAVVLVAIMLLDGGISQNNFETKLVDNLDSKDSETTFDGISVSVKQSDEDGNCSASSILVNDKEISDLKGNCVISYEFYDDNVIILASTTSNSNLVIYNTTSNNVTFVNSFDIMKNYKLKSYTSTKKGITVNAVGCGAQCGADNGNEKLTIVSKYVDGEFLEFEKE